MSWTMRSALLSAAVLTCTGCPGAGTGTVDTGGSAGTQTCPTSLEASSSLCGMAATAEASDGIAGAQAVVAGRDVVILGDSRSSGATDEQALRVTVGDDGVPGAFSTIKPPGAVRTGTTWAASENAIYGFGGLSPTGGGENADRAAFIARRDDAGDFGEFAGAPPLPSPRTRMAAAFAGNRVYLVGGGATRQSSSNDTTILSAELAENGSVSSYRTFANALPAPTGGGSAAVVKGHLFVFQPLGGTKEQCLRETILVSKLTEDGTPGPFAPATAALPTSPTSAVMVASNDRLIIVGGTAPFGDGAKGPVLSATVADDGTLSGFTRIATLPDQRFNHVAAVVGDRLFAWGGITESSALTDGYTATLTATGATCP